MGWSRMPRCQAGISEAFPEEGFGEECRSVMNQVEVSIISAQDVVVCRKGRRSAKRYYGGEMEDSKTSVMKKEEEEQGHVGRRRRRRSGAAAAAAAEYMAMAWIHPRKKMKTHVAICHGHQDPTWNAKLHFLVPDECLHEDSCSALTIQIFCHGTFRASLLGTARVLLSKFVSKKGKGYEGAQSMALHIRTPSGAPQGILNIGSMVLTDDDPIIEPPHPLPLNHLLPYTSPPNYHPNQPTLSSHTFTETGRKSFSTSRDFINNEHCQEPSTYSRYSSARLSLDYCNTYTREGLRGIFELKSIDSRYEEEEEEEEDAEGGGDEKEDEKERDDAEFSVNNMEAIYRKLQKQCKLIDSSLGINYDDDDAKQIGLIHEPVKADDGLAADGPPNTKGLLTNSDGFLKSEDGLNQMDSIASAAAYYYDEDHRMQFLHDQRYCCMENAAKIREDKNVTTVICKRNYGDVMNHSNCEAIKHANNNGRAISANDAKAKGRKKGLARWAASWALPTKGAARIHRSPSDKP